MGLKWTIFFFLGGLVSLCIGLNWMAGGSFTQSEFDILRGKVNAFDITSNPPTWASSAAAMSTELNNLWHPAWNVVIVFYYDGSNNDAVLYGYAFNGRWFWLNGFQLSNGKFISFVIWKDFNCVQWTTYNPSGGNYPTTSFDSTTSSAISTKLTSGSQNRDVNEIWLAAQDIQASIVQA